MSHDDQRKNQALKSILQGHEEFLTPSDGASNCSCSNLLIICHIKFATHLYFAQPCTLVVVGFSRYKTDMASRQ